MGIELAPGTNEAVHVKFEPDSAAEAPLHVTPTKPDPFSFETPRMPIEGVLKLIVDPLVGDEIVTPGGILSSLTVTDALAAFPALSSADPATT